MKFSKVRDVKSPERGSPFSAGIDFFVPEYDIKFVSDFFDIPQNLNNQCIFEKIAQDHTVIVVPPLARVLIPSGIKVNFFDGYQEGLIYKTLALIACNKSGVASKTGLDVMAQVIDQDYQGEVHLSLCNTSNKSVWIYSGQKIIQFIMFYVNHPNLEEVPVEDLYESETERGEGGFGSTDKK